ncbi:MAG: hypothetical protein L3J76_04645 [Candidatus Hydrothermae bacterium]|nr:hypothetical protein [Candidatus Hydrothermae bacterium]
MNLPLVGWAVALGFWPYFPNAAGYQSGWSVALEGEASRGIFRLASHHRSGVLGHPIRLDHWDMLLGTSVSRLRLAVGGSWWVTQGYGGREETWMPVVSLELAFIQHSLKVQGWMLESTLGFLSTLTRPALTEAGLQLRLRRIFGKPRTRQQQHAPEQ